MARTGYDQDLCKFIENQLLKFMSLQQIHSDIIGRITATGSGDGSLQLPHLKVTI